MSRVEMGEKLDFTSSSEQVSCLQHAGMAFLPLPAAALEAGKEREAPENHGRLPSLACTPLQVRN